MQSFKVDNVYSDSIHKIKRLQLNQFNTAYYFDTKNDLYKQLQHKLYKLGYDLEINGDFSRYNMYTPLLEYGRDIYNRVVDTNGITFYSLYNLLFDIETKIVTERELYINSTPDEFGNNYSFNKNTSDFDDTIKFKNKLIFLNPIDEFGELMIKRLIPMLNYYGTNYIDVKQYSLHENMLDRLNRIRDYINKRKIQSFVLNIGNAVDYSSKVTNSPTLLRGINVYHNQGAVFNDYRKIDIYAKYMAGKLDYYLRDYFEYIRIEKNNRIPLLKYFNDYNEIPTFQFEIGYKNNPLDKIILSNDKIKTIIANSLCHLIQRIVSMSITKGYTDLIVDENNNININNNNNLDLGSVSDV